MSAPVTFLYVSAWEGTVDIRTVDDFRTVLQGLGDWDREDDSSREMTFWYDRDKQDGDGDQNHRATTLMHCAIPATRKGRGLCGDVLITGRTVKGYPTSLGESYLLVFDPASVEEHGLWLSLQRDSFLVVTRVETQDGKKSTDVWGTHYAGLNFAEDYVVPPVVRVQIDQ